MGCGLSRFWKAARPRNAAVSDEEVTPLLLPAKEKPPDRPDPSAQEGPPPDLHPVLGHGFRVKFVCFVCALFGAAIGFAILLREPLKLQIGKDSAVPHCFIGQMFKNIHWMIIACGQHWMQLLLICMLVPALYVFKTCSTRVADCLVLRFARQEHVERFVAKAEVALMVLLWLADMLSDMYVAYTYCKQKLYVFAFLMILIWLGSGCLAFSHRYVSWERCDSETNLGYFAQGLNEHGEPKPGYKTFLLYILQVQPLIMALNSWQHGMTRRLQEEKMVAALTEAAPSSFLQLYALLLDPPKENSLDLQLLWGQLRCPSWLLLWESTKPMNYVFLRAAKWRNTSCQQASWFGSGGATHSRALVFVRCWAYVFGRSVPNGMAYNSHTCLWYWQRNCCWSPWFQIPKLWLKPGLVSVPQEGKFCGCHQRLPQRLLVLQYGRFGGATQALQILAGTSAPPNLGNFVAMYLDLFCFSRKSLPCGWTASCGDRRSVGAAHICLDILHSTGARRRHVVFCFALLPRHSRQPGWTFGAGGAVRCGVADSTPAAISNKKRGRGGAVPGCWGRAGRSDPRVGRCRNSPRRWMEWSNSTALGCGGRPHQCHPSIAIARGHRVGKSRQEFVCSSVLCSRIGPFGNG